MFRTVAFGLSTFVALVFAGVPGGQPLVVGAAPVPTADCMVYPPPPVPVSPLNLDTVATTSPTLRVEAPVPFNLYHFRVMEGASTAAEGYSFLPSWRVAASGRLLQRGHSYQWSCRGWISGSWSPWFVPSWQFSVGSSVQPPSPASPGNGGKVHVRRPLFVVKPASGDARYHFRVYDGKTLVGEGTSALPFWVFEGGGGGLEPGNVYSWTCRIEEPEDTSTWFSPEWSFEVVSGPAATQGTPAGAEPASVCATPNPFTSRTAVSLQFAARSRGEARVYSASGRLVRILRQSAICNLQSAMVVWDGRDESGREVGPGAYICRVWVSQEREEALKLEKLR